MTHRLRIYIEVQAILDTLQLPAVLIELQRFLALLPADQRLLPRHHWQRCLKTQVSERRPSIGYALEADVIITINTRTLFAHNGPTFRLYDYVTLAENDIII